MLAPALSLCCPLDAARSLALCALSLQSAAGSLLSEKLQRVLVVSPATGQPPTPQQRQQRLRSLLREGPGSTAAGATARARERVRE
jgi:hypothetical protein